MQFDMFIYSDGNSRETARFYARVFKSEVKDEMTYGEAPPDPKCPVSPADKDKIMYSAVKVGNINLMFMDMPSGEPLIKGTNISPTVSTHDKAEVKRLFNELREGGKVEMELQPTFYSEIYGMVTDKYGVCWQVMCYKNK